MGSNANVYRRMGTDALKQGNSGYSTAAADLAGRGWDPKLVDAGHGQIDLMRAELQRRGELA
ncbi:hypothetical protein BIV57_00525 [Mangrovactinospora gilvigrisea]|uniref:Uncharacterized protein n=1 Tax=Mangrovactinospora gilvigrisea TaxID=1428644 RepID=A0A1J7CCU1_9ACTN|nr:hypothetical protein [Mangrovactinospora gilvigrisea]OIV39364.1 hypothetical protein BIV57_00525 [Mangrovactinospora gilvigrisea]